VRLRHCQVIGTRVWRFRIDYLKLGKRTLAEAAAEGRRIVQLKQVVLVEEESLLAEEESSLAVVANNSEKKKKCNSMIL
jgi:hypothetical protein